MVFKDKFKFHFNIFIPQNIHVKHLNKLIVIYFNNET